MKFLLKLCIVIALSYSTMLGQIFETRMDLKDTSIIVKPNRIGMFFDYNINSYPSKFNKIGDIPSCSKDYTNGTGSGIGVGGVFEMPIYSNIAVGIRGGLFTHSAKFSVPDHTEASVNGRAVEGEFEYTLNANLTTVALEPMIIYNPFDHLTISLGLSAGFLVGKTFDQEEVITKPEGVTFLDSTTKRNVYKNQQITSASSLLLAGIAGIAYELPLNAKHTMLAVPEISYAFGLSNVITDGDWKINSLRAGVTLKYILPPTLPACQPGMERDADGNCVWMPCPEGKIRDADGICVWSPCPENGKVRNEKGDCVWSPCPEGMERNSDGVCVKVLLANINAVGVVENGIEMDKPAMRVEEFETTLMQPVLNYVFFDEGKSQIPERYTLLSNIVETDLFDENRAVDRNNPLQLYYNNLNVIAKRLKLNPAAYVTLLSYNVGGSEASNPALSHSRVNEIIDYWKTVWNLPASRILKKVFIPLDELTKTDDPYIMADYRRVEIIPDSNSSDIIEPVLMKDTAQTVFPYLIQFKLNVKPVKGIEEWNVRAMQLGDQIFDTTGSGIPPITVEWKPDPTKNKFNSSARILDYRLNVSDLNGDSKKTKMENPIPLEWITLKQKRGKDGTDSTYSKYIFLFKEQTISSSIYSQEKYFKSIEFDKEKSTVKITGYKDYYGADKSKPNEANDRANAVANYLKEKGKIIQERTKATGDESAGLYDLKLPEGRSYNRSVVIDVETKSTQKDRDSVKYTCCYLLYLSTSLEETAKSNLEILQQNGITDFHIVEWQDPLENIKYYRVRSKCYEYVRQAAVAKAQTLKLLNAANINKTLIIKVDK